MMKANELRIGNMIYWNIPNKIEKKIVHEVTAIINPTLHTCPISLGRLDDDGYVGIQLTEEWLLSFGFVKTFENPFIEYEWQYKHFTLDDKMIPYLGRYSDENNLKYVHQLQNLYFALTGDELKIK